jgi:tetratricopeptide (TPR) repeat protein
MTSSEKLRVAVLALVAFLAYANSLGGDFVYDDKRQILMNPLIQEPPLYAKALVSDVWAFKGDGKTVTSNYWRPTFTAWSILNFRLFGRDPFGWHLLNILLHVGVCMLAYLLLRRWDLTQNMSFAATLIFTLHPIHTESVAWIAGSPDLLFGLFLLSSFLFADMVAGAAGSRRGLFLSLGLISYALSLGAKETAFFCFPIFYLIFARYKLGSINTSNHKTRNAAMLYSASFSVVAIAYFLLRWDILGRLSQPAENGASTISAILSAPEIFAFYLRQIVFPFWLGPNYGIRAVQSVDPANFWIPVIISAAAIYFFWRLSTRTFVQTLGIAIFLLPLLPAFNIRAFLPEQIVHDRYLYLPLLGFLMMFMPFLAEVAKTWMEKRDKLLLAISAVICIALGVQTFRINRTWNNELSLWQHAVTIDPNSSSSWSSLGAELTEEDRLDEALEAYNRSLAIWPRPLAYIGRAQILVRKGDLDAAISDMKSVIEDHSNETDLYTIYQAYETLAIALEDKGNYLDAEKNLRDARTRLPMYRAALTEKLAVILYNENRKQDALRELENVKDAAVHELLPASKAVFFRLGLLYAEGGNKQAAYENLNIFLRQSVAAKDKETDNERQEATAALKQLGR